MTIINGTEVRWRCPSCRTYNTDDYAETAVPMCEACEEEFWWSEFLVPGEIVQLNKAYAEQLDDEDYRRNSGTVEQNHE